MELEQFGHLSPDEIRRVLEDDTGKYRFTRASGFSAAQRKYEAEGKSDEAKKMEYESILFGNFFVQHSDNQGTSDTDYRSIFTDDMINYYRSRTSSSTNPIMLARYCDIIWETKKEMPFLERAVDAYLDSCEILFANGWETELGHSLYRALRLSVMVKKEHLVNESFNKHIEYLNRSISEKRFRNTLNTIRNLVDFHKALTGKLDFNLLLNALDQGIAYYSTQRPEQFDAVRVYLERKIDVLKVMKDEGAIKQTKLEIAESFEKEADWRKSESQLAASDFYALALKTRLDIGDQSEKPQQLKVKMEEAKNIGIKTELKEITAEIELPLEYFKPMLEKYTNKPIRQILEILAFESDAIPSFERSKTNAQATFQTSIVHTIFPISLLNENIKYKALSEDEQKLEYLAMSNFMMSYKAITDHYLNVVFQTLLSHSHKFRDELLKRFNEFENVKESRMAFLSEAIENFIEQRYLSAMHILIFQVEGILRDIVGRLGLPVTSYRNQTTKQITLDEILEILKNKGFEAKFVKFIESLLNDLLGDNLRNDTAHGLGKLENYNKMNCQFLIYILIKLSGYNIDQNGNPQNTIY
jgi:hypothetical protein